MGNDFSREINLAAELYAICDEHGKEVDFNKSAPILHQYGLLYRNKTPDKISLIRSAVFFNAALTRHPSNQRFKRDLKELCSHVITLIGQQKPTNNLMNISTNIKTQVIKMRKNAKEQLSCLDTIPVGLPLLHLSSQKINKVHAIRKLQTVITSSFITIMENISSNCIKLIGNPPCQYAVVGMGSLARQEVTPYSDFEHIIILEENVQFLPNYTHILEYFRWFSVVFQIIVINLGETIIPSVSIPFLNNPNISHGNWFYDCHTTRGISFDGMMLHACKFPLGRTQPTKNKPFTMELIKPVSEMANYLQADEEIKNGYHLADMLTKTCFVSGSRNLYKTFELLAKNVSDSNVPSNINQIRSQLREDLQTYDVVKTIYQTGASEKWNIKRVIYRSTTLFVSALGRFHRIDKCSCFDIIDELLSKKRVSKKAAEKLSFAVAVACETRLKVYMWKQSQNDSIGSRKFFSSDGNITRQLCAMIGEQSLGDYFLTAQTFQQSLQLNVLENDMSLEVSDSKKFYTLFMLDLHDFVLAEWQRYRQVNNFDANHVICYYVAWTYIKKGKFQPALELLSHVEDHMEGIGSDALEVKRQKAHCLYELGHYKEGLLYIHLCLSKAYSQNCLGIDVHAFAYMTVLKGKCEHHLGFLENAIQSYSLALINLQFSFSSFRKNLEAKCYVFMGQCLLQCEKFSKAIESARKALDISKESLIEISLECKCYRLLAECYMHLNQQQKALYYFKKELKMHSRQITYKDNSCDSSDIPILLTKLQEATDKLKF